MAKKKYSLLDAYNYEKGNREASGANSTPKEPTKKTNYDNLSQAAGTRLTQMAMRESFGGSSFEKDYNDAMSAYNALASGWHDSDYISNTAKDLTAMRDRTEKYRTYQNIYGGMDDTVKAEFNKQMDNIGNQFEKTINNTGKYGELYSQFMNGRVYNKTKADMALAERYKDLTYDQVKAEREKYREGSPMYNFFNEYGVNIGYKDLKDYDKELADVGLPEESFFSKISAAPEDRKDGKANITGKNEKDKGTTYAKKLQAERNKYALDHTFDKYSDYLNAPDIDKYRTPQETENNSEGIKGRVIDSVKNIANGSTKYSSEHKLINTYFNGQSDVKFDTMHDDNLRNYEQMSSDEFAVYNKIYAEEGPEAAHKFLEDMKTILSKRATEKEQGKVSELLDKVGDTGERLGGSTGRTIASTVAGTAGTAVSLGLSLGSGLEAGADTALQMIQGKEVNPYGVYQRNQIAQENLTQKVSENIDKFTRENNIDTDLPLLHNVLPKIYEVGMSAATSYLGASAYGQSYENIMGLGAYASTMREMKEKGISQEDANVAAVIAGALEKITEDYSIENFLNIDNVDSVTAIGKAILSQMASEGQEEMASSIGNQVTDYLVNGGLSDYMHRVDEYMKQGYAEDRARNLSMHDAMMQVVEEGVAGAISGGMMGGPAAALNYSANKSLGNTVRQNNQIDDLFNTTKDVAESLDYNSDAIDYLRENRNGDGMEDAKIGVLYQKTLEDVNRIAGEGRTEEASSYEDRLYDYAKEKTAEERETIKKAKKIAKAEEGIVNSKTGEELKVNNVTKQNGETVVETDKGTMKLSEVAADDIHAKAIAYAENMNDEKSAVFMQTIEAGEVRNIDDFKTSFDLVYEKSFHNLGDEDILNISNTLTQKQALEIYKAVRANLGSRQNKRLQEIIKNHPGIAESKGKIDETAINRADLTSYQRNQMDITNHVYSMMGVNVVWLQSKADASGQFTEIRNGAFNIPSNTIYLDVNANRNSIMDMGNILSVASHEATHWLKLKSPVAYQELQKAVFDALAAGDSRSVEQMIAEEMRDTGVERDVAIEELVARACEDMLFNTDTVAESFAKMDAETKKTFVGRIKDAVKSVLDFFKEIRDSFKSDSNEAKTIQKNIDHLENVLAKFDAALKEGIENNRVGIFDNMTEEELNSLREISKTDSMTMAEVALKARGAIGADGQTLFNYKAMERDMPEYRKMLKEAGMSSKDIKNAFDTVDAVMEKVKEHLDILDYDYELDPDDRAFNPVKPNSDSLYKYSVDFSTLCRKRILQQIV